jgi:hypothetical protein
MSHVNQDGKKLADTDAVACRCVFLQTSAHGTIKLASRDSPTAQGTQPLGSATGPTLPTEAPRTGHPRCPRQQDWRAGGQDCTRRDLLGSLATVWSRYGHDLVTVWSRQDLLACGPLSLGIIWHGMVTVWSLSSHCLATVWPRPGHGPVTVWSRPGHGMVTVRSRQDVLACGPQQAPARLAGGDGGGGGG